MYKCGFYLSVSFFDDNNYLHNLYLSRALFVYTLSYQNEILSLVVLFTNVQILLLSMNVYVHLF